MQSVAAQSDVVAAQTFGRDVAMFQDLLSFMASLSLTLWAMVLATLVVRFVACHLVYRRRQVSTVTTRRHDRDEV